MKSSEKLREAIKKLQEAQIILAENVNKLLEDNSALVDEADISKAIESMLGFSACQTACIDEYKELFGDTDYPHFISQIQKKADEFDAQAALVAQKQEAMKVIDRFDSIKSLRDDYTQLLAEASASLHAIDSEQPIEDYKRATEKYDKFYDTVIETDIQKRSTNSLVLNGKFPVELILGLLQGQLFVEKNDEDTAEPLKAASEQAEVSHEFSEQVSGDDKSDIQIGEELTQEDIALIKRLREMGFWFDEASRKYGSVTVETGDETPVNDIRAFRKDMEKMKYGNAFGMLALLFQETGTAQNLSFRCLIDNKSIDFTNILQSLLEKGYIRKYTLEGNEPYYAVSEKGISALEMKGAYSLLKSRFRTSEKITPISSLRRILSEAELSCLAVTRHNCMKIQNDWFEHLQGVVCESKIFRCCYSQILYLSQRAVSRFVVSIGAFFESDFQVTEFEKAVQNHINKTGDCRAIILSSYNMEQCVILKDYVMSLTDKPLDAKIVYFCLDENGYFDLDGNPFDLSCLNEIMKKTVENQISISNSTEPAAEQQTIISESEPEKSDIIEEKAPEQETELAVSSEADSVSKQPKNTADANPEDENTAAQSKRISYDEARKNAIQMLTSNKAYCALAYLKAAGEYNSEAACLYKYLAYAYNDPAENISYNSTILLEFVNEELYQKDDFAKSLIQTAALRNFFSNDIEYDYNMKSLNDIVMSYNSFPELKWLSKELLNFKTKKGKGLDIFCDYYNKEHIDNQNQIDKTCSRAKEYYNQFVMTPYSVEIKMKRFMETYKRIFDSSSDFAECLKYVSENDVSSIEVVKMFINDIKGNSSSGTTDVSEQDIDAYINKCWNECCADEVIHKSTPLVSNLRSKLYSRVSRCLVTMTEWLKLHSMSNSDITSITGSEKNDYISNLTAAINFCNDKISSECEGFEDYISLRDALNEFLAKINGSYSPILSQKYFYIDFLRGYDVVLNENYCGVLVPDLKDYCHSIDGADICSRIINHANNAGDAFPTADDFNQQKNCDISSLDYIIRYLDKCGKDTSAYNEIYDYFQKPLTQKQQDTSISQAEKSFVEYMELAQSFGKFDITSDNSIKDNILYQTSDLLSVVRDTRNYGFFFHMIDKIKVFVEDNAKNQEPAIRQRLENIRAKLGESGSADELIENSIKTIEDFISIQNYTAAEDLINRISNGDLYDSDTRYSPELLNDFHNQYSTIYNICNNTSIALAKSPEIERYIRNTTVAKKDENGGMNLIKNWITGKSFSTNKISMLLEAFGIDAEVKAVKGAESYSNRVLEYYECKLKYADEVRTNYQHIFAPFGSQGYRKSFRVVCLYGANNCDRILKEIDDISSFNKDTIIFVDYAYQEADRGKLARVLKKRCNNEIYLVIDRVFVTYLAAHYQKTSITKQLMNLAVPFSYYQPYVPDSANFMPPEMFIGRKKELNDIKSEKGVHMLYGGRQLGKTALLKKAQLEIDHNGDQRAVRVDLKHNDVVGAATAISNELIQAKIFKDGEIYTDWKDLANAIRSAIKRDKIGYLLLLLDEGDKFIDDCKKYNYEPIDTLKSIMDDPDVRFKFVIAGLHNLVRYDHASSTQDNSVIPHLKTLTIKPFSYAEARELLQYPLSSLGIYFKDDEKNQGLVSTILATTNYFPGLIQFYCSQLVESLCRDDCPCYVGGNLPPYYVSETQIQKLLANEDFTKNIKEKFQITLSLDKDNYYEIIALSLAYLCRDRGIGIGYTSKDILDNIAEFNISKVSSLSVERISMLMDELVDLNIFRETDSGRYVFSRQNFMQLMGSQEEIFDALYKYGTDNVGEKR